MKYNIKIRFRNRYITVISIIIYIFIFIICKEYYKKQINNSQNSEKNKQIIRVIDGDTIKLDDKRIRLYAIDAPEIKQVCYRNKIEWLCGQSSKERLIEIIGNKKVHCVMKNIDLYKREVSICYIDNGKIDIAKIMVREGMAIAYKKYSKKYVEDENYAKNNSLGIWNSKFKDPSSFRANKKKKRLSQNKK